MKVTLVACTEPRVGQGILTAEQFIVYCARVSNPNNQLNVETAPKLLAYCVRNKHWSIFEQVMMTVEIVTSRAIATQILRHRSFAFQEFSQRYAVATKFENIELRKQSTKNRQGGEELLDPATPLKVDDGSWGSETASAEAVVADAVRHSENVYAQLLQAGVAKECARMVLPLCTQTTLYMTGSVRSWIHYLQVRCDPHTQKEHREIADAIRDIFRAEFPDTSKALWFS